MPSTSTPDLDLAKSDHERNNFSRHYDKLDKEPNPELGIRFRCSQNPYSRRPRHSVKSKTMTFNLRRLLSGAARLTHSFPFVCFLIALLSLGMRSGFPVHAIPNAGADDALFVSLARSLGAGHWLGSFNNLTLGKGMFYPLFIEVSFLIGLPLKIAEQLTYLATAYLAATLVRRATVSPSGRSFPTLAFIIFVLLAFNPVLWTDPLARVIREGLYISLSLAVVVLTVWASFPPVEASPRFSRGLARGAFAGLAGTAFWLTREEGLWLAPAVALIVGLALVDTVRRHFSGTSNEARPTLIGKIAWRATPWATAFAVFLLGTGTVALINFKHYGVFETTEVQSYSFRHAYGAIARIEPDTWQRYVVFPKDARDRAYAVSAAARELAPVLDGPLGDTWRRIGCAQMGLEGCPEILAGWFLWAFRDAVATAGHYRTARDASDYYTRLANEIDSACASGALRCRPPRATLAPPFRAQYVSDTLHTVPRFLGLIFRFGEGEIAPHPSDGPANQAISFGDMVGPIEPQISAERVVSGWVTAPTQPEITLSGIRFSGTIDTVPAPDVRAFYPGLEAIRFALGTDGPPTACHIVVSTQGTTILDLPLQSLSSGSRVTANGVTLWIDEAATTNPRSASALRQSIITAIAVRISRLYAPIMQLSGVIACLGLGFAFIRYRRTSAAPELYILALASLTAVATYAFLLSYIDVTSFHTAGTVYSSSATPFAIIYSVLGCYLGIKALRSSSLITRRSSKS